MVISECGNWVADLMTLTCWNCTNKIVVSFEKHGQIMTGRIKNIPLELMHKLMSDPQGKQHIRDQLKEAEKAFLSVYLENAQLRINSCNNEQ